MEFITQQTDIERAWEFVDSIDNKTGDVELKMELMSFLDKYQTMKKNIKKFRSIRKKILKEIKKHRSDVGAGYINYSDSLVLVLNDDNKTVKISISYYPFDSAGQGEDVGDILVDNEMVASVKHDDNYFERVVLHTLNKLGK